MTERRGLTVVVLAVAAGAGLVLLGASRVWWVEVVPRPAPLRPEEIAHTGGSLAPLLPALGLVALAAAGGLLATRGVARRLVGALLTMVALGVVVAVAGALRGAGPAWPAACLVGAVLVGA
ncbi:MAG: Trp biosynthesis-associated membrane protein, partial [Micromonosporaceae bacterium]|nr:Trp biosynthesis-associated membrane protein [Micromonosporaceae bacterium]